MKRCAFCGGRLGLGVRFRNRWNGTWWQHLRFCSAFCEANDELERRKGPASEPLAPPPPLAGRGIAYA
jgi:hypothetical protein